MARRWRAARAIGQALLDRGPRSERPVVILSDNGIDHALLALGAMHVGVPVAPVSPAYSLLCAGLRQAALHRRAGRARARSSPTMASATPRRIAALALGATPSSSSAPTRRAARRHRFAAARSTPGRAPAVDAAFAAVGPDTVAKILFTSGSTGQPKGVINTQRMLCSNQQSDRRRRGRSSTTRPPVIVDWLPWSHTFGGNHNFNMVLRNGGTLYIDGGKPAPGLIERTRRQPARGVADALLQRAARLRAAARLSRARRRAARRRSSATST